MSLIDLLQQQPWLYLSASVLLGLLVGSFLNVVAHRLPQMMERDWRTQCRELTGQAPTDEPEAEEPLSLLHPRSRCPACAHGITALENIPVLSYLFLRGRCSACGTPISLRYPVVEAVTGVLTGLVAWHFGASSPETVPALLLTWALISLSLIDMDTQLLPDSITLPFLWLGLLLSLWGVFAEPRAAIIGAVAGYLFLWTVYQLFKRLTGKEGMGYGDFKLLALFGAWFGWQYLPQILFIATVGGACIGLLLAFTGGRKRGQPIPFGPYLAVAGWSALMWGDLINTAYLNWSGLST